MTPLLLLSLVPAVLGFYLGWRRIASGPRLIAEALIISFVGLTLFLFAFGNPPRQISTRYFLTASTVLDFPIYTFFGATVHLWRSGWKIYCALSRYSPGPFQEKTNAWSILMITVNSGSAV